MKKWSFLWILALVICFVIGCAEKEQFEQELQTKKREQFKEKLSHEVTQTEARESLEKILFDLKLPSTRGADTKLPPITSVYTTGKTAIIQLAYLMQTKVRLTSLMKREVLRARKRIFNTM